MDPSSVASLLELSDWEAVLQFLPAGWREQARECGALRRARGIAGPEPLLRVLLLHLACGYSLVESAARARLAGWAEFSAVALYKRLKASEEWLRWMAAQLREEAEPLTLPVGRRLRAVDATAISEPGATGTDWRIHYAVNLRTLQCDFFELTGVEGGETWRRFPIQAGDIMVGDRAYANGVGVRGVVRARGDVIVRWKARGVPLETAPGKKLNFLAAARGLAVGQIRDLPTQMREVEGQPSVSGRLLIVRRTAAATARVRQRLRRRAQLKNQKVSPAVWRAAAYFAVWTTLPSDWSAPQVLEYYRRRWQIELCFKRLKSILGIGHLPKTDPASCRAWLHGKLLVSLLIERMIQAADRISPWGYELEPTA